MKSVVSYEKVHHDFINSKGEFPFIGSTDYFNEEEVKLIKKYGYWFEGLCTGELPLINPQQVKFKKVFGKIYQIIEDYPPESTKWWKSLTKKQKVWVRYVRFIETERQKSLSKYITVNEKLNEVKFSDNKCITSSYVLTHDLDYYFNEIFELSDNDKVIIKENIDYWNNLFNKSQNDLNEKEKSLLNSLKDDLGPSETIDSVFHYFFRRVKSLNLKDVTHYRYQDDSWYSDEMYKQMRSMMFKNTRDNHRRSLK